MTVNELVKASHEQAVKSGWWEPAKSDVEVHMLIVTEIAEATEAARLDQPFPFYEEAGKPEGEAVELADAIIRIADYFGRKGWDLERVIEAKMNYNSTRPHRHGNKKY